MDDKYGRLTVVSQAEDYVSPSGNRHKAFLCRCDCGNEVVVLKEHLTSGRQKSCGCLRHENGRPTHQETGTRLYRIWGNMVNRCTNPNNPAWRNYGKRGISVCDEWKNYEFFRDWALANGYSDNLTIDRINNNDGYNPGNCRWVNTFVQANNTRRNHEITYDGETHTISEWARIKGIPYKTLHRRIVSLKWNPEDAFNKPVRSSKIDC